MAEQKENNSPNRQPVVTGQQIGLLGGPFYTPYKVLGAVATAAREGRPAIYWLETNDADFQEISAIDYIDRDGGLKQLRWRKETGGLSCGRVRVDDQLIELIRQFFQDLTPTEFTPALREMVLDAYRLDRELGEASLALARSLFPFENLSFFDPRDVEFRSFCRPILLELFENTAAGEQCPGFIDDGGVRRAVFRRPGGYALRDGRSVDPGSFPLLPNVHSRPLCQDAWFGSSAYIAGPGEMAYLAPLADLYRRCGVEQPRLIRRMSLCLIEPWSRRQLDKLGFSADSLLELGPDKARAELIRRRTGLDMPNLEQLSRQQCRSFIEGLSALHPYFSRIETTLDQEIKQVLGNIRKQNREQNAADLDRLQKLFARLQPYAKPQERVICPFYYMNLYGGTDLLKRIYERYDPQLRYLEVS